MATREEYVAAAAALGKIAQTYMGRIPEAFLRHVNMDEVNKTINDAAVVAVDAAEKVRVASKPHS